MNANMERTDYEKEARTIADGIGLTVKAAYKGDKCPKWEATGKDCKHIHGDRYRVTLAIRGKSLSFDFWNSKKDKEDGERPGYYDILSCISSDFSFPIDPDEVVREYGDMMPSQAIAIAAHAKKLQAFFTEQEAEKLQAIS